MVTQPEINNAAAAGIAAAPATATNAASSIVAAAVVSNSGRAGSASDAALAAADHNVVSEIIKRVFAIPPALQKKIKIVDNYTDQNSPSNRIIARIFILLEETKPLLDSDIKFIADNINTINDKGLDVAMIAAKLNKIQLFSKLEHFGCSLLSLAQGAVLAGNTNLTEDLVKKIRNINPATNLDVVALAAAQAGNVEIIQLCKPMTQLSLRDIAEPFLNKVAAAFAKSGNLRRLETLLQQMQQDALNINFQQITEAAAETDRLSVIEMLFEHAAKLNKAIDLVKIAAKTMQATTSLVFYKIKSELSAQTIAQALPDFIRIALSYNNICLILELLPENQAQASALIQTLLPEKNLLASKDLDFIHYIIERIPVADQFAIKHSLFEQACNFSNDIGFARDFFARFILPDLDQAYLDQAFGIAVAKRNEAMLKVLLNYISMADPEIFKKLYIKYLDVMQYPAEFKWWFDWILPQFYRIAGSSDDRIKALLKFLEPIYSTIKPDNQHFAERIINILIPTSSFLVGRYLYWQTCFFDQAFTSNMLKSAYKISLQIGKHAHYAILAKAIENNNTNLFGGILTELETPSSILTELALSSIANNKLNMLACVLRKIAQDPVATISFNYIIERQILLNPNTDPAIIEMLEQFLENKLSLEQISKIFNYQTLVQQLQDIKLDISKFSELYTVSSPAFNKFTQPNWRIIPQLATLLLKKPPEYLNILGAQYPNNVLFSEILNVVDLLQKSSLTPAEQNFITNQVTKPQYIGFANFLGQHHALDLFNKARPFGADWGKFIGGIIESGGILVDEHYNFAINSQVCKLNIPGVLANFYLDIHKTKIDEAVLRSLTFSFAVNGSKYLNSWLASIRKQQISALINDNYLDAAYGAAYGGYLELTKQFIAPIKYRITRRELDYVLVMALFGKHYEVAKDLFKTFFSEASRYEMLHYILQIAIQIGLVTFSMELMQELHLLRAKIYFGNFLKTILKDKQYLLFAKFIDFILQNGYTLETYELNLIYKSKDNNIAVIFITSLINNKANVNWNLLLAKFASTTDLNFSEIIIEQILALNILPNFIEIVQFFSNREDVTARELQLMVEFLQKKLAPTSTGQDSAWLQKCKQLAQKYNQPDYLLALCKQHNAKLAVSPADRAVAAAAVAALAQSPAGAEAAAATAMAASREGAAVPSLDGAARIQDIQETVALSPQALKTELLRLQARLNETELENQALRLRNNTLLHENITLATALDDLAIVQRGPVFLGSDANRAEELELAGVVAAESAAPLKPIAVRPAPAAAARADGAAAKLRDKPDQAEPAGIAKKSRLGAVSSPATTGAAAAAVPADPNTAAAASSNASQIARRSTNP